MAKRVFFSFHYEDVITFRVNVVRNHHLTKETGEAGFFDASIWEKAKSYGSLSLKRLINSGLENTTVSCVLIGSETWRRPWVRYEILKSYERGNSLIGIHINNIPDKYKYTYNQGNNPFDYLGYFIDQYGKRSSFQEHDGKNWQNFKELIPESRDFDRKFWSRGYILSRWVKCYDWVLDDGYNNFAKWVENAE